MRKHPIKAKVQKWRKYLKSRPTWMTIFLFFTIGYTVMTISAGAYVYQHGAFTTKYNVVIRKEVTKSLTVRTFNDFPGNLKSASPCFGPESLTLNESFSEMVLGGKLFSKDDVVRIVEYLSKFKDDSNIQIVLHIPDWASRIFKSTNHSDRHVNNPSRPPYFLTAVVRLRLYQEDDAKLTMSELKQWIHYQLWAGAEHIYICNHFLNESERIEPDLQRYIDLGIVTVYPWNKLTSIPGSHSYVNDNMINQDGCYNHVLERHSNESVWQYNMDMDEYPFVPSDQCEGFFKRYLFNLDHGHNRDLVSMIKLSNFLMKGVGDRTRDMGIDRINRIDRAQSNPLVKPCYKLEFTKQVGTHGVTTSKGLNLRPSPNEIVMLHYWGSRTQKWGPDTPKTLSETIEFNAVKDSITVNVRHSLLAFVDYQGFNTTTGP